MGFLRTTLLLGLASLGLGCSESSVVDPLCLVGTWVVDMDSFQSSEEFQSWSEQKQETLSNSMKSTKFIFTADTMERHSVLVGEASILRASYKVIRQRGPQLEVERIDLDESGEVAEGASRQVLSLELNGDTLTMPNHKLFPALKLNRIAVVQEAPERK